MERTAGAPSHAAGEPVLRTHLRADLLWNRGRFCACQHQDTSHLPADLMLNKTAAAYLIVRV